MKNILLVYPPFCTPASPPYSITYLCSFLKNNCKENIEVLDLNLEFHKKAFPEYQKYYQKMEWKDYGKTTSEYIQLTKRLYSKNNKQVINKEHPGQFNELLNLIKEKKPDIVAFSIVYSSQAFYAYALIKELKDIVTIVGGPSVNEKLESVSTIKLNNELELLNYIKKTEKFNLDFPLDFSAYNLNEYFTPKSIIPIKTTSTCYYKQCTFCTHFSKTPYYGFPLGPIKETIINSKQKYFFLIDDMIPTKRLLELAAILKPLSIFWTCQLRPTQDLNYEIFKKLRESGLTMLMWGIESGNQRILDLINKGTNKADIAKVLEDSHNAGIKNIAYMLFGFPTETKDEFLETIEFLKDNERNIDLVSTSVFGLQKGTAIYNNHEKFGITEIAEEPRTILDPKLSYKVKSGLTQKQAKELRQNYKRTIEKINKYPHEMNFFREHMFCLI